MTQDANPHPSDKDASRLNLFDHLRLLAALSVFITHEFGVRREPDPAPWLSIGLWGAWGVNIFFAISGYLNTLSLLSSRSLRVFLISRAARIYPALIACILMTVLIGSFLTTKPHAYWSAQTFEYLWHDSTIFMGGREFLPGLFDNNPVKGTNASLWTLAIEARFYIYLAIGLLLTRFNRWPIVATFAIFVAYLLTIGPHVTLASGAPSWRLGLIFVAGSAMAACQRLWGLRAGVLTFSAFALALALVGQGEAAFFLATAIVSIVVGQLRVSERFRPPLDISYGFYLYAFPMQQIMVALKLPFLAGSLLALLAAGAAAILSALFVERPAIRAAAVVKRWIVSLEPIQIFHSGGPAKGAVEYSGARVRDPEPL